MPTVHLLHGFNVSDGGKASIDRLIPHLRDKGFIIREHDYGWRGLLGVLFFNQSIAEELAEHIKEGDICIGHSNGCAIIYRTSLITPITGVVFINPALDVDLAANADWVHVYHNEDDLPVKIASKIWFVKWGQQGRIGYKGDQDYVTQFDCKHTHAMPSVSGHSDIFNYHSWRERISMNMAVAWNEWDEQEL